MVGALDFYVGVMVLSSIHAVELLSLSLLAIGKPTICILTSLQQTVLNCISQVGKSELTYSLHAISRPTCSAGVSNLKPSSLSVTATNTFFILRRKTEI